jgi:hypothetical protein
MNKPTTDVERVVREVLAELDVARASSKGDEGRGEKAEGGRRRAEKDSACGTSGTDLVLSGRVVTMAEVAGRLESVRRLVVLRQAVVTPAVRDELLCRGIALARADSARGHLAAVIRLVVMASGTEFRPAGLMSALAGEGFDVELQTSDCLIDAADQLADELAKPNTLGVLLTADAAAGLCLANRLRGIRAVADASAADAVGANLLIVDPKASNFFQLKQMVAEFCRGGVRPCPEVFRTRLA